MGHAGASRSAIFSRVNRTRASASAGASSGGTTSPATPSGTTSASPPTSVVTTGRSKWNATCATPLWVAET